MLTDNITNWYYKWCEEHPLTNQKEYIINELLHNKNSLEITTKCKNYIDENGLSLSIILIKFA